MKDNKKLKEQIKLKIAISDIYDEEKDMVMKNKKNYISKKIGIAACLVFTLTSVVFAKDIETFIKIKFGLGKGIETAVENGYIETTEMNFIESQTLVMNQNNENVINDINASVKINDFLMDDYNLSVEFDFQFDDKIKAVVNLDNLKNVELSDLIVIDEENRIIFNNSDKDTFEKFCKENNLNYKYQEFNDKYMNNGLNSFIESHNAFSNLLTLTYNMYAEGYPKSKELNFIFNTITMTDNDSKNKIILTGNWNIDLKVPEKMYNRTEEYYKVTSCESENFEIYTAKVTDTGFELGLLISNIEKPIYPQELSIREQQIGRIGFSTREDFVSLYGDEKYVKLYEDYTDKRNVVRVNGDSLYSWGKNSDGCYVLNSNGEKFICTMGASRKRNYKFVDNNKYDFYETFEMTKYDATDDITIFIDLYGKPVKIELKKI